MPRYQKWVLTLGILAATPGIGMAAPFGWFKSNKAEKPAASPKGTQQPSAELKAVNQKTAEGVAKALRSAKLNGYDIQVEFKDGVATLSGSVRDPQQREMATKVVERVEGVQSVNNQLGLLKAEQTAKTSPFGATPAAEARGGLPSSSPIRQMNFDVPAAPSVASNQQMAERIASSLSSAKLNGFNIEILFEEGTAILRGSVADNTQRQSAHMAASRVPGVQRVANELTIQGQPPQRPNFAQGAQAPYGGPIQQAAHRQPIPQPGVGPSGPPMESDMMGPGGQGGMPPQSYGYPGPAPSPTVYDMPYLPEHAWPSYAPYPNSAQVSYPNQYSASAWPYIGPFYPYPQVPLGWRQAQLEWDDGFWQLNFNPRTDRWWWFVDPKNW